MDSRPLSRTSTVDGRRISDQMLHEEHGRHIPLAYNADVHHHSVPSQLHSPVPSPYHYPHSVYDLADRSKSSFPQSNLSSSLRPSSHSATAVSASTISNTIYPMHSIAITSPSHHRTSSHSSSVDVGVTSPSSSIMYHQHSCSAQASNDHLASVPLQSPISNLYPNSSKSMSSHTPKKVTPESPDKIS